MPRALSEYEVGRAVAAIEAVSRTEKPVAEVGCQEAARVDGASGQGERRNAGGRQAGVGRGNRSRARWGSLHRQIGGNQGKEAQSGGSVHHLDLAAGVLAQAAIQRETNHGAGAAAV